MMRLTAKGNMLYQSAVPAAVGGTANEVVLASVSVPAMGPNDGLRVAYTATYQSGTNVKSIRAKLNGVTLYTSNRSTSGQIMDNQFFTIYNRNSVTTQIWTTTISTGQTTTPGQMVNQIDTSGANTFQLTGQTTLETAVVPTAMSGTGSVCTATKTAHGLSTGDYIKASGSTTAGYNVDGVQITVTDANTFTYPGTGTGTPATPPNVQRYSAIKLEMLSLEVVPGV